MAESGKPACKSCGSIVDTDVNTADSMSPVPIDQTQCGKCEPASDYYAEASPCVEDHTVTKCEIRYVTTVKAVDTFNFPAIGESASIKLENVKSILPGMVLWNESHGFLHVQSFASDTGIAVVQNRGEEGNSADGALIPACTEFAAGIPPLATSIVSSGSSEVVPFLGADFQSPAPGSCQLATVTNVNGLSINDIVSINSFEYRIGDILSATSIQLCNDGQGAPTAQNFSFDANCDGKPDIQIIVLSSDDPCSRDGVQAGQIIVCDSGVRQPLVGTVDGQVPVWDATTERFILVNSNIAEECTALSACAIFDVGNAGPYIIEVVSSALFSAGDTLFIGEGSETVQATVQDIVSATQIRINLTASPTEILEFDPPARVCVEDCCADFSNLVDRVTNLETVVNDPVEGLAQINDELDDTIREECYPSQITQVLGEISFIDDVTITNIFTPTDNGGNFQRHYNYDDTHPLYQGVHIDETIGPFDCDVEVDLHVYGSISMAVLGADPDINDIFQFHDLVLGIDGNDVGGARQFAHNKGGANFTKFLDGQGAQPVPAGFALADYAFTSARENYSFHRRIALAAGATSQVRLLRRMSIDGPLQQVNWGAGPAGGENRLEWAVEGTFTARVWRV